MLKPFLFLLSASLCTCLAQGPLDTTVLNVLYRVKVGNDYMTTTSRDERDRFASDGAIFYIPSNNIDGTSPVYRLYAYPDHMDSVDPNEGGYNTEGILGYPWTTSNGASSNGGTVPALFQLIRNYDGVGDHGLQRVVESLPGYDILEGMASYGFGRYNHATESLLTLSAGGVTIDSNGVAGGVLWNWYWNGVQFVNHADYGREIQSSVFYTPTVNNPTGIYHNPTEAGSSQSAETAPGQDHQGSPWINLYNSGNTQVTTAVPLNFVSSDWGGDNEHPVIYTTLKLGKQITLNYAGLGPVAQYVTTFSTQTDLPNAFIEIPTGYLNSQFNRFYTYDSGSQSWNEVTAQVGDACPSGLSYAFHPSSGFGGVIISDSLGQYAMAVYGALTSSGGSISDFVMWNFQSCAGTSKWDAVYGSANDPSQKIAAGDHAYNAWIMTGTVSEVQGYMNSLFSLGVR